MSGARELAARAVRLATGLLALLSGPALAATLTTVDPQAHYPEGPLWRNGKLYFVEYSASNIKSWDGQHLKVYWHKDGCGANSLIPFGVGLLVACYDNNSLVEIDARASE